MKKNLINTEKRCLNIFQEWRNNLFLSEKEKILFEKEIFNIDNQLDRFLKRSFRISVFGKVGVGKSSVLNALIQKEIFNTDIQNGSTSSFNRFHWEKNFDNFSQVEFIDTPGIDDINTTKKDSEIELLCNESDLILFILDNDLTNLELHFIELFIKNSKPIMIVINKCDHWDSNDVRSIKKSIKSRLPKYAQQILIKTCSASPRKIHQFPNGKIRSYPLPPDVKSLRDSLINFLNESGSLLSIINMLNYADKFNLLIKKGRLQRGKSKAQETIGKFAALKASSVAISPLAIMDISASLACDAKLVIELGKIYGLKIKREDASNILKRLSLYSFLLGGIHLSFQISLSFIRHLLFIATPFSSGLSLLPAAPIALLQAALAVHTTKLTGRFAAEEFLEKGQQKKLPHSMLSTIANNEPSLKRLMNNLSIPFSKKTNEYSSQSLIP